MDTTWNVRSTIHIGIGKLVTLYESVTAAAYAGMAPPTEKVMTHAEYDQNKWKEECGCFTPAPKPTKQTPRRRRRGR
jgi:hypothetical protein